MEGRTWTGAAVGGSQPSGQHQFLSAVRRDHRLAHGIAVGKSAHLMKSAVGAAQVQPNTYFGSNAMPCFFNNAMNSSSKLIFL